MSTPERTRWPAGGDVTPLPARQGLADDVHEAINALLMDGVIAPRARITIDTVARQLGVSPTPVREALARLESDGLVVKKGTRGYFATPTLELQEINDLYDLRLLLEPWAAARAAVVGDPAARAGLLDGFREVPPIPVEPDYTHLKALTGLDAQFHDAVLVMAGNGFVRQSFLRGNCHLHLFRLQYGSDTVAGDLGQAVREHESVARAIDRGDPAAAEEAMRGHLTRSRDRIAALFG